MTNSSRTNSSNLVRWLSGLLGVTVIKAYQDEDRPALPYVMVNLLRVDTVRVHPENIEYEGGEHAPDAVPPYPPVTATPVFEGEWDFSLHAYAEKPNDPTDILLPLKSAAALPQIMEPLFPDLVISDISQIRHVPDFIENRWEMRAQCDFSLRGMLLHGFEIDVVEQAQINVERET